MYFPEWFYEDLYNHVNDGIFTSKNEGLGIFWCEIVSSSVSLDLCLWKCAWRSFSDESKVLAITLDDKVSVAGIEQLASDLLPSRQFGHIVLHLGAQNDRDFGRAQCIPKFHVYIYILYIHINMNMDIIMNLNVNIYIYIDLYTYIHLYTMLSLSTHMSDVIRVFWMDVSGVWPV